MTLFRSPSCFYRATLVARLRRGAFLLSLLAGVFLLLHPEVAHARRNFTGENNLGVPRDVMMRTQQGLEMVYQREYSQALDHFEKLSMDYPDSAVGHTGRAVAFSSMMLENDDFSFEEPYKRDLKAGYEVVTRALKAPSQKAWNYFLYATLVGVDGIHDVRRGDTLSAFNKGWDAVEAMKRSKQVESQYYDPDLGLGIYNYWRTAITRQVKSLPKFGDHRAEGIAQMRATHEKGLLGWAAAGFALVYTYWEDRQPTLAIAEALKLRKDYPKSVVNNMVLGRIYADTGKYDEAHALWKEIQRDAPENKRVWFYQGDTWFRQKNHDKEAEQAFMQYLKSQPQKDNQAATWYRLGQIKERAGDLEGALGSYQMALSLRPKYPACEKKLAAIKQKKMEGGVGKGLAPVPSSQGSVR